MSTHWIDRSRLETGNACARKRYWNYHFASRGLQPLEPSLDLLYGTAIHAFVENMSQGKPGAVSLDREAFASALEMFTPDGLTVFDELNALYAGHTYTFEHHTLPRINEEYEWLGNEVETTTELAPGINLMTRRDADLRRKSDGKLFVLEIKTSSWLSDLQKQSVHNFQLLLEQHSLASAYPGQEVGGAVLLVFDKGSKRKASEKEQSAGKDGYRRLSPFTYCYRQELADGSEHFRLDYTAAKGWSRTPTSAIPGWLGILEQNWPDQMKEQVQLWNSVSFDEEQIERVLRQVVSQETRLHEANLKLQGGILVESIVDDYFPQNFANCESDGGFRRECPFKACCFSPNVARDPLASELYRVREPNHRQELGE